MGADKIEVSDYVRWRCEIDHDRLSMYISEVADMNASALGVRSRRDCKEARVIRTPSMQVASVKNANNEREAPTENVDHLQERNQTIQACRPASSQCPK